MLMVMRGDKVSNQGNLATAVCQKVGVQLIATGYPAFTSGTQYYRRSPPFLCTRAIKRWFAARGDWSNSDDALPAQDA